MWTIVHLTLECVSFKKFAEENGVKNKKKYQSNYLKIWIFLWESKSIFLTVSNDYLCCTRVLKFPFSLLES